MSTSNRGPLQSADDIRRHIHFKRLDHSLKGEVAERMLAALAHGAEPDYAALLHAATFTDPPALVYHTAPPARRATLAREGLKVSQPGEGGSWAPNKEVCRFLQATQPPGVYVTSDPDELGIFAHWPAWDIWEIRRGTLAWRHDTLNPGCWSFCEDVPASQIWLLDTFGPGAASQ